MIRPLLTACVLMTSVSALVAQASAAPPADFLRSINKLYVVVAVIVIVFLGLAYYLWSLDRKVTDLENQINDHV
ncbi:hypothetical protein A3850_010565 [Lewinella sp. 4G2]|nr:hypothetical protein A3850_010565 [Lewinella sp. 4G2]